MTAEIVDDPGRAWGWLRHLRSGGATAWEQWRDRAEADSAGGLPGAHQLEFLRRLQVAQPGRVTAELATRVLAADPAGRGPKDLRLAGAGGAPGYGPPAVNPSDLSAEELTRVAVTLLAEDLTGARPAGDDTPSSEFHDGVSKRADTGRTTPAPATSWVARWRRASGLGTYRIVGDPVIARRARQAHGGAGLGPGGRRPRVWVVGTDVATMLVHAWADRLGDVGAPPWPQWLQILQARGHLPPRIDLAAAAARWSAASGPGRVLVAVVPQDAPFGEAWDEPDLLTAPAAELGRQVAQLSAVRVSSDELAGLVRRRLLPPLAGHDGPPLVVPQQQRDWVDGTARRLHRSLAGGPWRRPDHLHSLLPRHPAEDYRCEASDVLDLAMRLLAQASLGRPMNEEAR